MLLPLPAGETPGAEIVRHLVGILKRTSSLMLEQGYAAARFSITGEDGAGALTELLRRGQNKDQKSTGQQNEHR